MSTPVWSGNNVNGLIEQPTSGRVVSGDSQVWEQSWAGKYTVCLANRPFKGSLGTGAAAGWRVRESTVDKDAGGRGILRVVWEPNGITPPPGASLPQDTMSIKAATKRVPILQHPHYATLAESDAFQILWRKWQFREVDEDAEAILDGIRALGSGLGTEFAAKIVKEITELDLPRLEVQEVTHSWGFPTLVLGGEMVAAPSLPAGGSWPAGFSWLRLGDDAEWNGSFWRRTRVYWGMLDGVLDLEVPDP